MVMMMMEGNDGDDDGVLILESVLPLTYPPLLRTMVELFKPNSRAPRV
jgi:hypothetical protein